MNEGEAFSMTITVPGHPRGKGRPRSTVIRGRSHVYTDAKTRSEEGAIRQIAGLAMGARAPYEGAVILRLCAYREIPASFSAKKRVAAEAGAISPTTKPDIDNYVKMTDALNGVVWRDDSQVVAIVAHKRFSDRPRLVIDVRSFGGAP